MTREETILKKLSDPSTIKEGFSMLVAEYSEQLYWLVRRMVLNHEDANDIVQNAFIKAWTNLSEFEGRSKISTWLSRIAVNESLDFLRKKKQQQSISMDMEPSVSKTLIADEWFDGDKMTAILHEAVDKLPDVQRTVFIMKYFEERKYSEISAILGTSEGALKASYHHAVKKIEEHLKQEEQGGIN